MNELPVQKRKAILLVLTLLSLALILGCFKRMMGPDSTSLLDLDLQIAQDLSTSSDTKKNTAKETIYINTADIEALSLLSGIGVIKADRIIKYRQAHGRFESINALLDVKGIGPKTLENLKDYISLK